MHQTQQSRPPSVLGRSWRPHAAPRATQGSQRAAAAASTVDIKLAHARDYWAVADAHCQVSPPVMRPGQRQHHLGPPHQARRGRHGAPTRLPPRLQVFYPTARDLVATLLRLDRCLALQINDRLQGENVGR